MTDYDNLALRYVLADEEPIRKDACEKAARGIEASRASSLVLGSWTASIRQWMPGGSAVRDDGEQGSGIIARAKALDFLASSLEALDPDVLRTDQIKRIAAFFETTISSDQKAGVTAAVKALRRLSEMRNFKPELGVSMLESLVKMKENFRLQTPATRLGAYRLMQRIAQDATSRSELERRHGASCSLIVDLLRLCDLERDPGNLMTWFDVLKTFAVDYEPSDDITEELFRGYSAYFPIALKSGTSKAGVTAGDLKEALRECFAAHHRFAALAFPFLIQKLDEGDGVSVSAKVDILRTIEACVDRYDDARTSIVPHICKIWSSLKYEVRNGEVKDTIDATLDVLRAIARRLDGNYLGDYMELVFGDCRDDLGNPIYTKQAGLLLITAVTASVRAYAQQSESLLDTVQHNLRQPKSDAHAKDLVGLLNAMLGHRAALVEQAARGPREDRALLLSEEVPSRTDALFHQVYLPRAPAPPRPGLRPGPEQAALHRQIIQGLALLTAQKSVQEDGRLTLSCSQATCQDVCRVLGDYLFQRAQIAHWDALEPPNLDDTLDSEAVRALQAVMTNYSPGFPEVLAKHVHFLDSYLTAPLTPLSLQRLKEALSRLAFVGCSEIPQDHHSCGWPAPQHHKCYSACGNLLALGDALLRCLSQSLWDHGPHRRDARVMAHLVAGLHAALLNFLDACTKKYGADTHNTQALPGGNWVEQFSSWSLTSPSTAAVLAAAEHDADTRRQALRYGLFVVWRIYRDIHSTRLHTLDTALLAQIQGLALLVVGNLSEDVQKACRLEQAAFDLFASPRHEGESEGEGKPGNAFLTLGILEGLWPGAMTELYVRGGVAEQLMGDTVSPAGLRGPLLQARSEIVAILANKYPGNADPSQQSMRSALAAWTKYMSAPIQSSRNALSSGDTAASITVGMHLIAGAIARQDRDVADIVPVLHECMASDQAKGVLLALSTNILFKHLACIDLRHHGVVKRLHKQWAYNYLVRPLFERALPVAKGSAAERYLIVILAAVKECDFVVYQDDLDHLVRLLITVIGSSTATSSLGLVPALSIANQILAHEPSSLQSHLNTIIPGTARAYQDAIGTVASKSKSSVTVRSLALSLVSTLPEKYEGRRLRSHAPRMHRVLPIASGDAVRDIRKLALRARERWGNLA